MGGGKMTRPDFELPQADEGHPMTEFYRTLQKALGETGQLMLPGLWAAFRPPLDRKIYLEEAAEWCSFSSKQREGWVQVLAPQRLPVLFCELQAARDGAPSALRVTRSGSREAVAVRLLPPGLEACQQLPEPPDLPAVLEVELDLEALLLQEEAPDLLGRALRDGTAHKRWLRHPAMTAFLEKAVAAQQRSVNSRTQKKWWQY